MIREKLRNWRPLVARLSAEFAIIVLGVSIALWADGCVAERSDRIEEEARLYGLADNVGETYMEIQSERENIAGAIGAFEELFEANSESDEEAVTRVVRYAVLYGPIFSPELNVYDDLKNSGELALLTNPELRQALARMDSRLQRVAFAQSDLLTIQQINVDTYMIEHLDMQTLIGPLLGIESDVAATNADFSFLSDREFRNRMLMKLDLVMQLEDELAEAAAALKEVHEQIVAQLPDVPDIVEPLE
ncbi:MAG: hypothetical protein QNI99_16995 [Woeseiaceae bacterium]|nr:hypothetical protein [Woeseiaceae bacterium]